VINLWKVCCFVNLFDLESPEDASPCNFLTAHTPLNISGSASNAYLYSNDFLNSTKNVDVGLFDHYYVIHNINLLWKKDVRNTLFKLFDLQSKNNAIKVCDNLV
jgi:hypothetical protein